MANLDDQSAPSLLEPESRGGDTNERGKEFEAAVTLTYIPRWMAMEGFTSMLREGIGGVEAKFFVPGRGFAKELVEVKDHQVPPAKFWKEIKRFQQLDAGSPGEYQWFTLASAGLSESLHPLVNSLRRLRGPYGFYGDGSLIMDNSYRDYEHVVVKLGRTAAEARFLYTKVRLQDDLTVNHSYGRALFIAELQRHHSFYRSLLGYVLDDIHAHLSAFVRSRRNQTIMRRELEEKLMERVAPDLRPPMPPVRIHTIASDDDPDADDQKLCFEWSLFFSGEAREYPPAGVWNERLHADLQATKDWILQHRMVRRIALSGSRRLSASLAIGFVFSAVSGFAVEMMYRGSMWATDAHPNSATPPYTLTQSGSPEDARGDRLVVSIGIMRDIAGEVESDLGRHGLAGMPVLHLKGEGPIVSPQQANLVIGAIKAALTSARSEADRLKSIHLALAGPSVIRVDTSSRPHYTRTNVLSGMPSVSERRSA